MSRVTRFDENDAFTFQHHFMKRPANRNCALTRSHTFTWRESITEMQLLMANILIYHPIFWFMEQISLISVGDEAAQWGVALWGSSPPPHLPPASGPRDERTARHPANTLIKGKQRHSEQQRQHRIISRPLCRHSRAQWAVLSAQFCPYKEIISGEKWFRRDRHLRAATVTFQREKTQRITGALTGNIFFLKKIRNWNAISKKKKKNSEWKAA